MQKKMKPAISKTETAVSASILVLLIIIAAGVFLRQFRFNPAVISHQQLTASQELKTGSPDQSGSQDAIPIPEGMKPLTPAEVFTPETLYEKIDGKAELYLSAGFKQLRCQRITLAQNPDLWMEIFIYEMKTVSNAFSVFSMQRRKMPYRPNCPKNFPIRPKMPSFSPRAPIIWRLLDHRPARR